MFMQEQYTKIEANARDELDIAQILYVILGLGLGSNIGESESIVEYTGVRSVLTIIHHSIYGRGDDIYNTMYYIRLLFVLVIATGKFYDRTEGLTLLYG